MNRQDARSFAPVEAVLRYEHNNYTVLRNGGFVRCGVTGQVIAVEDLRYWSVERQEPYASREAALRRHLSEKA